MPPQGRTKGPKLKPSDAENLHGTETGRATLSHTRLSSFLNCPRRWQLSYEERLELRVTKEPLLYGRAFQHGLEENDPNAAYDLVMKDSTFVSQEDYDKLLIRATVVKAAAKAYLKRWPAPAGEQREFPYRVRLRNPWTGYYSRTFDLLGYADGVRVQGNEIELIENKFVSQITDVSVRRLPLDRQLALACYGLWRATGLPVSRVTYRFTRKPSIQQRKSETADQYRERLREDYEQRGADFYTHEEVLYRTSEDLLRVECELWEWGQQILAAQHKNFAPRNSSHCADFGGCDFIPICVGEPDARDLYVRRDP